MRVRLLTDRAGPGGLQAEGEVIDLPDDEARRMVATHQAEPADVAGPPTSPPPAVPVKAGGRRRKR